MTNNQTKPSTTAPVIVTRTQSQSNVRNATSTLVQLPQIPTRNSLSTIITFPSYNPITTEL